jgi:hypothetical protein
MPSHSRKRRPPADGRSNCLPPAATHRSDHAGARLHGPADGHANPRRPCDGDRRAHGIPAAVDEGCPNTIDLGALVIGPLAQAEPVHLTCEGEMHLINANGDAAEKYEYALSLAIDQHAGTVTVGTYQGVAIPSKADSSGETLMFLGNSRSTGVSGGTLNRRTGKASIHIITGDGLRKFYGICKPTRKLF